MPTLFPFQHSAVGWLSQRPKAVLALEQGLGKTVVAAVDLIPPAVVVCTAAMKFRWAHELAVWRPDLRFQVIRTVKDKIDWSADAWIINYDILSRFKVPKPTTLVVDECHRIKTPDAQRTGAVINIANRVQRVRYLSGTPMLSRPAELYILLKSIGAIDPGMSWEQYGNKFCDGYWTRWRTYDARGSSNLDELKQLVRPHMLRLTKRRVMPQLPPKTYRIVELPQTQKLTRAELNFVAYHKQNLELPSDPIAFQAISDIRRMHAERKLPQAVEYVRDLLEGGTQKVVVFAHHRDSVQGLYDALEEHGAVCVMGGARPEDVERDVQSFQHDVECKVFVGSLQACGEGLTLTAASHVVLVEPSWVPSEIDQAADRCHRIGTVNPVLVDLLCVQESIDARMLWTAMAKIDVIEQVIKETEMPEQEPNWAGVAGALHALANAFDGKGPTVVAGAGEQLKPRTPRQPAKPAPAETSLTLADVRQAAAAALAARKRTEVQALLGEYEAKSLSLLKEEHYDEFVEKVSKLTA